MLWQNILGICPAFCQPAAPALIIYEYLLIYCFALFMVLLFVYLACTRGGKLWAWRRAKILF